MAKSAPPLETLHPTISLNGKNWTLSSNESRRNSLDSSDNKIQQTSKCEFTSFDKLKELFSEFQE